MSRNTARKRKRQKLKCSVCNRTFDDDYRLEHNQKYHPLYQKENKHVPYEVFGAAKKPFEAAKKKQSLQVQVQREETSSESHAKFNVLIIFIN